MGPCSQLLIDSDKRGQAEKRAACAERAGKTGEALTLHRSARAYSITQVCDGGRGGEDKTATGATVVKEGTRVAHTGRG